MRRYEMIMVIVMVLIRTGMPHPGARLLNIMCRLSN
jgi:hypothetical protein